MAYRGVVQHVSLSSVFLENRQLNAEAWTNSIFFLWQNYRWHCALLLEDTKCQDVFVFVIFVHTYAQWLDPLIHWETQIVKCQISNFF